MELPTEPLIVIEPRKSWRLVNLSDFWSYRELLYFLTWRDVKVRYKQTALGATWAILQPLLLMLIFNFFFARLAGIKSGNVPYPIFAYSGLLPWTFFATAVTNSGNSLIGNTNLITKVYFPRLIIPAAAVGAALVDLIIAFGLLVVLIIYYGINVTINLALLPMLLVLLIVLALSVGLWMAALNVKYRDVRYALPFLMQLWMFASPVVYPASLVPEKWRLVIAINPMSGLIAAYRATLFGQHLDVGSLAVSVVVTFAILIYSIHTFRRVETTFADVV